VEDGSEVERDRQRAEVFDALGHPTRIVILKALSEGALGFADLKKKTAIDSSGHLQHHLNKLNGLIKTDEYGKYCLSSEGKEALLTVQTVEKSLAVPKNTEKHTPQLNKKLLLKSASILLVVLLISSSAIALFEYNKNKTLQKEVTFFSSADPQEAAFYNQFGVIPSIDVNSSFSPPISAYNALQIGLPAHDWNKTSLQGMTVNIFLAFWETTTNSTGAIIDESLLNVYELTNVPTNYSDVHSNNTTYQYVWYIGIEKPSETSIPSTPHWGDTICVDAATGQIISNPFHLM
jgi:DNA-binding HxlR family transcriptional regulator